jgi:hypothetical protein
VIAKCIHSPPPAATTTAAGAGSADVAAADTLEGTLAAVLAPECHITSEASAVVAARVSAAARSSTPCTVRGCEEQQQQHGSGCLVLHAEHCDGVVDALEEWKGGRSLTSHEASARTGTLRALKRSPLRAMLSSLQW